MLFTLDITSILDPIRLLIRSVWGGLVITGNVYNKIVHNFIKKVYDYKCKKGGSELYCETLRKNTGLYFSKFKMIHFLHSHVFYDGRYKFIYFTIVNPKIF